MGVQFVIERDYSSSKPFFETESLDRCGEARRSQLIGHRMRITSSIVPTLY